MKASQFDRLILADKVRKCAEVCKLLVKVEEVDSADLPEDSVEGIKVEGICLYSTDKDHYLWTVVPISGDRDNPPTVDETELFRDRSLDATILTLLSMVMTSRFGHFRDALADSAEAEHLERERDTDLFELEHSLLERDTLVEDLGKETMVAVGSMTLER